MNTWDLFWHKTTTPAAILSKRNILNLWWLFNGPKVRFNPKVWWSTRTSKRLIRTHINCMQCLNLGKIGSHIEHYDTICCYVTVMGNDSSDWCILQKNSFVFSSQTIVTLPLFAIFLCHQSHIQQSCNNLKHTCSRQNEFRVESF